MSAFPDQPDHFLRWLAGQGLDAGPGSFVPRQVYGRYLDSLVAAARAAAPGRLDLVAGEAVALDQTGNDVLIALADGRSVRGDAAVIAVGNLPPHAPPAIDAAAAANPAYIADPWHADIAAGLGPDDIVLVIGTGLTMVDVAIALDARGFPGRILAISRRGLLPRPHGESLPPTPLAREQLPRDASGLLHTVRANARRDGWRSAVDALRPLTQAIWGSASADERGRFLRHLRAWWDVHRHRLAPTIAARIETMRADGRLRIAGGKLERCVVADGGFDIRWRPRGKAAAEPLHVARIVNCTGPQGDLLRAPSPLLHGLAAAGTIRPDRYRLGIDVDAGSHTLDAAGAANDRIYAIGPITRGAFWEITAVPDIRIQAWQVARRLSNAHWVEGEGL
jgi:uncharacterized NAD(P)/FAD-binding protein YdhS